LNLENLGWGEPFASAFAAAASDLDGCAPARVVAVHRGRLVLSGANGETFAIVPGRVREHPTIGDWVAVDAEGVVRMRLPRRGVLARAGQDLAANVEVAFVVTSPNLDLNARRLERFVAVAGAGGCAAVLVLNKADLALDLEPALAVMRVAAPGVPVLVTSALKGHGVGALAAQLGPGRTGVLLGSSGVGKSALVNALLGDERQATAQIRARDDRGRHTTTHRALFALPGGDGLLVDTPGVRQPRMTADAAGVAAAFADVQALAAGCRFSDCRHDTEPGCAVQEAIAAGTLDPARLRHRGKLEGERRWAATRRR
jgi:ribosome biogenesis GTPase / thiamine phosphate phosphatase